MARCPIHRGLFAMGGVGAGVAKQDEMRGSFATLSVTRKDRQKRNTGVLRCAQDDGD